MNGGDEAAQAVRNQEPLSGAPLRRSLAAAAGAGVGVIVAMPVLQVLGVWLFDALGPSVMEAIGGDELQGDNGIERGLEATFQVIAGVMVLALLVALILLPVLVALLLAGEGVALRLVGAALIVRTLVCTLLVLLAFGLLAQFLPVDLPLPDWVVWLLTVATAGFVGRQVVERRWPDRAALP